MMGVMQCVMRLVLLMHDVAMRWRCQTADSISMMVDTVRTVSDRISYCDDEPMLNVVVIRQLVVENNVS